MNEIKTVFEQVLLSSAMASVLIGIIFIAKAILKNKLSATWHYYIWILLIIRLAMPVAPECSISIFNIVPYVSHQSIVTDSSKQVNSLDDSLIKASAKNSQIGYSASSLSVIDKPVENGGTGCENGSVNNTYRKWDIMYLLIALWLIGALIFAIYTSIMNLIYFYKLKLDFTPGDDLLRVILDKCKAAMGIKRTIPIVFTGMVQSPSIFGVFRPKLLLPYDLYKKLTNEELKYIFFHELAHIKRNDLLLQWIAVILKVLHWFNPIIWIGFYKMHQDCEMACDALALSYIDPQDHKEYGYTIIHLLKLMPVSRPQWIPGATGMLEDGSKMKKRIKMISLFKKSSIKWTVVSIILIGAISVVALTNAKQENKKALELMPDKEVKAVSISEGKVKDKTQNIGQADEKLIDEKLELIVNPSDKSFMVSSNPYAYIRAANKEYNDIIAMGRPALQYILKKFENSKEDGLESWIMASVCCEILGEGNPVKSWSSGRMWYEGYIKALSGSSIPSYPEVEGKGVVVTLSDSKVNDNKFFVHDSDIRKVVNVLLEAGGAKAISINGERIVPKSGIRATAGDMQVEINGVRYAAPFVIKVVGNPENLYSVMVDRSRDIIDGLMGYNLIKVEKSDHVTVPEFSKDPESIYIQSIVETGDNYPSPYPKLYILDGKNRIEWIRGDANYTGSPDVMLGNTNFGADSATASKLNGTRVNPGKVVSFQADEVKGLNKPQYSVQIFDKSNTLVSYPSNQNIITAPKESGEYLFALLVDWGKGDNKISYWFKLKVEG